MLPFTGNQRHGINPEISFSPSVDTQIKYYNTVKNTSKAGGVKIETTYLKGGLTNISKLFMKYFYANPVIPLQEI